MLEERRERWVLLRRERKVGFTENTAMRHRRGGFSEVTVTSRLHRQIDRIIEKVKDQIEIYTNKTTSGASHSSPD